jgi:hypothetical protein
MWKEGTSVVFAAFFTALNEPEIAMNAHSIVYVQDESWVLVDAWRSVNPSKALVFSRRGSSRCFGSQREIQTWSFLNFDFLSDRFQFIALPRGVWSRSNW